jgi:hypothetical protein
MEATQEDGEQDRIRIMQDEDEILSLQAELDETLIEMEESSRRARYNAGMNLVRAKQLVVSFSHD